MCLRKSFSLFKCFILESRWYHIRWWNIWTRLILNPVSQTFTSSYHPFSLISFDKSTFTSQCSNASYLSNPWESDNYGPHSSGFCWLESVFHKSIKKKVQWHFQSLWIIPSSRWGGSKPALYSLEYCSSHLFGDCSKLSNWNGWINLFILWIH